MPALAGDADLGQQGGQASAGLTLADVVQADVEVIDPIATAPPKLRGAAPGDVVGFKHRDAQTLPSKLRRRHQAAQSTADDGDVYALRHGRANATTIRLVDDGRRWRRKSTRHGAQGRRAAPDTQGHWIRR